jgi:hypothetical protein
MKRVALLVASASLTWLAGTGCHHASTAPIYSPHIDPANFVAAIDNPLLPFTPGTVLRYEGTSGGEPQVNTVTVTHETRGIIGVTCVVVADSVFTGVQLVEATLDWYAQDRDGNVWYFGEDSKEYQNGVLVSTEGSWLAGVDGAKPGIVMEADPKVGDSYRQEYQKDVAEDQAQVLSLGEQVTVPFGSYAQCPETKEWTRLEPGVVEHKYYARSVGMLKSVMVAGGSDQSELVSVTIR